MSTSNKYSTTMFRFLGTFTIHNGKRSRCFAANAQLLRSIALAAPQVAVFPVTNLARNLKEIHEYESCSDGSAQKSG